MWEGDHGTVCIAQSLMMLLLMSGLRGLTAHLHAFNQLNVRTCMHQP